MNIGLTMPELERSSPESKSKILGGRGIASALAEKLSVLPDAYLTELGLGSLPLH